MKFIITKTSSYDGDEPPCPDAVREEVPRWDFRTFQTPEEYDKKLGERDGNWLDEGTEHTTWKRKGQGGICRRMGTMGRWVIHFKTLDALMSFSTEHGALVIQTMMMDELPTIEIYDDYRE